MRKNRVEIVTTLPTPYRIHLFNYLDRRFAEAGLEFRVHFMAYDDKVRPKEWFNSDSVLFKHRFWPGWVFQIKGKYFYLNLRLVLHIFFNSSQYLIVGGAWSTFTNVLISLFCLKKRQIKVCWFEINTERVSNYGKISFQIKKYLLSKYPAVAIPGNDAIDAVKKLINNKKTEILPLPNLIDENRFKPRSAFPIDELNEFKKRILPVVPTGKIAILPARHSKEKGVIEFIEGVKNVEFNNWQILLVGKGPLQNDVLNLIRKYNLENHFICIDFISYNDMPKMYAISDLFILPSIWDHNPLTVIEALHCALPVMLSQRIGNFYEALGEKSENGWSFSPDDPVEIENICNKAFSTSEDELINMSKMSKRNAQMYWDSNTSTQIFVNKLVELKSGSLR